jgi:prevent-host-death family protein
MTAKTATLAKAKDHFSELVHEAERGGSVIITRHGRAVVALVPIADLPLLNRLRASGPAAGLASLAGGWPGSDQIARAVATRRRSSRRRRN